MGKSHFPDSFNKKEYVSDIAEILLEEHSKKKYYSPEEVKEAHKESKYHGYFDPLDNLDYVDPLAVLDLASWAMSIFSSHTDFDRYHLETESAHNYVEMKSEMLYGIQVNPTTDAMDVPDIDMDASWLDFGEVFDGIFDGIGDFVGEIFSL